jgi:mevalonate kinase
MNSQSLQTAFPETYQTFFSKCPIVCSCPRSFSWFGEQAARYEGFILRQNLPLKTYVGLVPQKKKEIKIADCLSFNPNLKRFQKETFDSYQQEKIEKYFLAFLKKINKKELAEGFQIYILNELPIERGLGAGAFIVALVSAALMHYGKLDPTDITSWKKEKSMTLSENKSLNFDFLFKVAWKWENFLYPGASGGNLINLMPSATPILFFSKRVLPSEALAGKKLSLDELDFIDQNYYRGIRFNEIVQNPLGWPWPFDHGLIYTGEMRNVLNSITLIRDLNFKLINVVEECKKDFKFFGPVKEKYPLIYKLCQTKDRIWYEYIATLIIISLQNYLAFKTIFRNGFSPESLRELAELLNKEQHLFYLLNLSSSTIDTLCSSLLRIIKRKGTEDTIASAKISGSTRRGDIVFLVTSHHIRDKIEEIIDELKSQLNKDINLDYASWLDGYEEEGGLKVEQFWAKNIYNKIIPENSFVLKEYKKGAITTHLLPLEKIKKEKFDLFLDAVHKKIFLKGSRITSKQLPTQAATIEILSFLLNKFKSVSNRDLPASSYKNYRNEMQGKIAYPLSKLTKGKIKIILEGGLLDFVVKLEIAPDTKIGLLKKVGN